LGEEADLNTQRSATKKRVRSLIDGVVLPYLDTVVFEVSANSAHPAAVHAANSPQEVHLTTVLADAVLTLPVDLHCDV